MMTLRVKFCGVKNIFLSIKVCVNCAEKLGEFNNFFPMISHKILIIKIYMIILPKNYFLKHNIVPVNTDTINFDKLMISFLTIPLVFLFFFNNVNLFIFQTIYSIRNFHWSLQRK